ncbi:Allene oxide synthase-lipoxygenase protein [Armadillidium vulgare]|nr:Allene oxide synthase-lipoxygenase protein [Armadillidium vulgare]
MLSFFEVEQLIETITGIISTCSLGHAAANSQQYEQYAFIPNYPGTLSLDPPTVKVEYTDDDILALLPSKTITLDTVVITNLLSSPITNTLGDFEVQYLYHPEDVQAADSFREELKC